MSFSSYYDLAWQKKINFLKNFSVDDQLNKIMKYIEAFWQEVDMIYEQESNPEGNEVRRIV